MLNTYFSLDHASLYFIFLHCALHQICKYLDIFKLLQIYKITLNDVSQSNFILWLYLKQN